MYSSNFLAGSFSALCCSYKSEI
ncbi:hypothetical protein [Psychroserpens sp.]